MRLVVLLCEESYPFQGAITYSVAVLFLHESGVVLRQMPC